MPQRKKILILTSSGGGGHIATANALLEHLDGRYLIEVAFPLKTFLAPADIFFKITFGRWDGEKVYNYFVRKGYFRLLNLIASFGCGYFLFMHKRTIKLMRKFLTEHKPDLVISVIPLINGSTLEACKQLEIPFLITPTDFNTINYLCNISKPDYHRFFFALAFEDSKIRDIIKPAHIPDAQVAVTGFLIRPGFLKSRNFQEISTIKQDFNVPENKPVLLLLMGAQGSANMLDYVRTLATLKSSVHMLIAIGKNKEMEERIQRVPFPTHISHTIIAYTNRMPDLMAISDILVTKPGPNSIAEALYSRIPMFIDTTNSVLAWEQLNVDFVIQHGFGACVKKLDALSSMIDQLLTNKNAYDATKNRIENFPKKNGLEEISKLIELLLIK